VIDNTTAMRIEKALKAMENLVGRLEVALGRLAPMEGKEVDEPPPLSREEQARIDLHLKTLEQEQEQRLFDAQILAERVNSGELTDDEKEEYMTRWQRAARPNVY
jgi:hypothetical protein